MDINPIDITETLATRMNLDFSRIDDNEISVQLKSEDPRYILSVLLKSDCDIICFSCDMNLCVTREKYAYVTEAIVKANEKIWVGHFDLVSSSGNRIVYSLTIPFLSSFSADEEVMESMIRLVTDECNRFYPYFSMIMECDESFDFPAGVLFLESAGEA